MNRCSHPKCQTLKPLDMFACKRHWFSLPAPIRLAIWDAVRKYGALSSYWFEATDKAFEFWRNPPPKVENSVPVTVYRKHDPDSKYKGANARARAYRAILELQAKMGDMKIETPKQLAILCGVTPDTIYGWRRHGILPQGKSWMLSELVVCVEKLVKGDVK